MTPQDVVACAFIGGFFALVAFLVLAACAYGLYQGLDRLHESIEARREESPADGPPYDGIDGTTAVAMAGWCCGAWAATAGTHHDPDCPRQNRSRTT